MTRRGWAGALAGRRPAPAGVVARGLVAGLAGTAAMTAYQTAVLKARGAEPSSTPGEMGRRIVEGVLERRVPEERMGLLNNGMHLAYGTSWGAPYAILYSSSHAGAAHSGLLAGLGVWAASLVALPALKLAPPVWKYPPDELAVDVSSHLVYGLSTAAAYRLLDSRL